MLSVQDYRRLLASQGVDMQLTSSKSSLLKWRKDRADGLRVLGIHPAVLIHSEAEAILNGYLAGGLNSSQRRVLADIRKIFTHQEADHPLWYAQLHGPPAISMLKHILVELGSEFIVQAHDNRQLMLSMRRKAPGLYIFGFHYDLFTYPERVDDLIRFARRGGHGSYRRLDRVIQSIFTSYRPLQTVQPEPKVIYPAELSNSALDPAALPDIAAAIHERYFAAYPMIPISWSRDNGSRQLRSIRFGSFRSHPEPHIRIHPRLARPWVSLNFLEHVIHHELCHWRQHCEPLKRERHHSTRFKKWERAFAGYEQARTWERRYLAAMLAPWPQNQIDEAAELSVDMNRGQMSDSQMPETVNKVQPKQLSLPFGLFT